MKIGIPADSNTPDAQVSQRFNTAGYLMIFDSDTGEYEALPNPFTKGGQGAGLQAILLAVSNGADAVLCAYVNPAIADQLRSNDIEILSGFTGTVGEAVKKYREISRTTSPAKLSGATGGNVLNSVLIRAFKSTTRQFANLLPIMMGVVFLTGLFNAFVPKEVILSLFTGNPVVDTLLGASFGSILAGNPVNSYIIGGELLNYGVNLFAVTAVMISWVTVGLIQLPAEIAAFGKKFALIRNALSFVLAVPVSLLTVILLHIVTGGML